jgi:hypothetical protein
VGSHHWPILLDNGEDKKNNQKFFYFLRKKWLIEEGFEVMVAKNWDSNRARFSEQRYSMDVWNGCSSLLR